MGLKRLRRIIPKSIEEGNLELVTNTMLNLKQDFFPHPQSLMAGEAILVGVEMLEQKEKPIPEELAKDEEWLTNFLAEGHILLARAALHNLSCREETRYIDYICLRYCLNSHYIDIETDLGISEEELKELLTNKKSAAYQDRVISLIVEVLDNPLRYSLIPDIDDNIRRGKIDPILFDLLFKETKLGTFSAFRLLCWKRLTQNSYNGLQQFNSLTKDEVSLIQETCDKRIFSEEEVDKLKRLYRRGKRITHLTKADLEKPQRPPEPASVPKKKS